MSKIYYNPTQLTNTVQSRETPFSQKYMNNNCKDNQEKFMIRALEMPSQDCNILPRQFKASKNENESKYFSVSTEKQKESGIKAEHFFSCFLKSKYGDSYNEYEHWVSSARNVIFPSKSVPYDDSLGYDFTIDDFRCVFVENASSNTKKCFIEVKGTDQAWDGTFHVSQNEKQRRDLVATHKQTQTYLIVVIEHVCAPDLIKIACIIDWSDANERISLNPDSYLATYMSPSEISPANYSRSTSYNIQNANTSYSNRRNNRGYNNNSRYASTSNNNGASSNSNELWTRNTKY